MTIYFCDLEADGFLEDATKIHCISVRSNGVTVSYSDVESIMDLNYIWGRNKERSTLVWHNGHGYDIPLLKRFGVYNARCDVDTLAVSREWFPEHSVGHKLEAWAKKLGSYKPTIGNWKDLPIEEYIERCEEDVNTTELLYNFLLDKIGIENASD